MIGTRPTHAERREQRPRNESSEHWRLKRLCRYIAWASGGWASAPEFCLLDYEQRVEPGMLEGNKGRRSVIDMLAIGKVLTKQEPTLPGEIGYLDPAEHRSYGMPNPSRPCHYLGLIAYECKASLNDLRAGMVTVGAHKHYCVVPESLRDAALKHVPKGMGVIVAGESRGSARGSRWHNSIVRGARRRDDAVVPMWCYTKTRTVPAEWTRLLLSMAVCSTNYAVRWQT